MNVLTSPVGEAPSELSPRASHRSVHLFAGIVLLIAFALLPLASQPTLARAGFNTMCCAIVFITEAVTAFLLATTFSETKERAHLMLSGAYAYSAAMALLMLLSFPNTLITGRAVLGSDAQTPAWIFLLWMNGFSAAILASAVSGARPARPVPANAGLHMAGAVAGAVVFVLTVACGAVTFLPPILADNQWTALNLGLCCSALGFAAAAVLVIYRAEALQSALFQWAGCAVSIYAAANLLGIFARERFTVGWAGGRVLWCVSAGVMLFYFLNLLRGRHMALAFARDALATEVRRSDMLLRAIAQGTDDLLFAKDRNSNILFTNEAFSRLLGVPVERLMGHKGLPGVADSDIESYLANDRRIMESGVAAVVEETITTAEGTRVYHVIKAPMRDAAQAVVGLVAIARDITEKAATERKLKLLVDEVSHRSNNMLAVIQALVRLSARHTDPVRFSDRINERLASLAISHDLLVHSNWEGAGFADLVRAQCAAFENMTADRVRLDGLDFTVRPEIAHTLGMVVHELATNAAKYGALSRPGGAVDVGWRFEGERFHLRWRESGGPEVAAPARKGYGHMLLTRIAEKAAAGAAYMDFDPAGVSWRLDAAARQIKA